MKANKSEIITRIRLILDEIGLNDSDFEGEKDEQDLDKMIEEFSLEALRFVNLNAPHELLEADQVLSSGSRASFTTVKGLIAGTAIGVFEQVDKFLRLVCARCSAWTKPVYEPIKEGTPSWDKLHNKFLTGTTEDPMVSVGKASVSMSVDDYEKSEIRLYCIPASDPSCISEIYYMEQPSWSTEDKLHISYLLQDAFFYYLAYLVLLALGDGRSQIALQQALPLMGMGTKQNT